jgi:hypothetical protein
MIHAPLHHLELGPAGIGYLHRDRLAGGLRKLIPAYLAVTGIRLPAHAIEPNAVGLVFFDNLAQQRPEVVFHDARLHAEGDRP